MELIVIYKILNPVGKVYIGQSRQITKRLTKYRNASCKAQIKLYQSIIKYGWSAHCFEIIHELPIDAAQETINDYEILYMQMYKDCGFKLLNIKGGGSRGVISEETKKKLSDANKGKFFRHNYIQSAETTEKIRQKLIGRKQSEETKIKIGNANRGRKLTPEHIEKVRIAQMGNKNNLGKKWANKKIA